MQAIFTILTVIIGIVFILLLFSLLSSSILEIVASILSLRGKHLLDTLQNMLGSMLGDFMQHPFFKQLMYASHNRSTLSAYSLPTWMDPHTFSNILADLLRTDPTASLEQKIQNLPDDDLKKVLLYLLHQTDGSINGFKMQLENWFNVVMDRASDWYKRSTKWWLFGIGFTLAFILNADTIQIYQSLSTNSAMREDISKMADMYVQSHDTVKALNMKNTLDISGPQFKAFLTDYQKSVQSPMGLGWTEAQLVDNTLSDWIVKIVGFIITGISVTFGAPFWFEVLKKLISIRQAVPQPPPPPPAE
jgi:hypothetical protein